MASLQAQRAHNDVAELRRAGFPVRLIDDSISNLHTFLKGPKDTPYEGLIFEIRILIPPDYPFKSPSVTFMAGTMPHVNVDYQSGSICLDVLSRRWSSMYTLKNVMATFLPYLLTYPNPSDPLNGSLAMLFNTRPDEYKQFMERTLSEYKKRMPVLTAAECALLGKQSDTITQDDINMCAGRECSPVPANEADTENTCRLMKAAVSQLVDAMQSPLSVPVSLSSLPEEFCSQTSELQGPGVVKEDRSEACEQDEAEADSFEGVFLDEF